MKMAYLSVRHQCMSINDCISESLSVLSGVPQVSILGPLLFLIFINDLPPSVKHSSLFPFADDAKCLKTVCSLPDCHQLQKMEPPLESSLQQK